MLYLQPHFFIALSIFIRFYINITTKVPLLLCDPTLKYFSEIISRILKSLLIIYKVNSKKISKY